MKLSDENRALITEWQCKGILLKPDEQRLDLRHGLIAFPCSDGDQFCSIYDKLCAFQTVRQRGEPRLHVLGYNGGPLELAPSFQSNRVIIDYWVRGFRWAMVHKNIPTGVLLGHVACSAVRGKLTLVQQMMYYVEAKRHLKSAIPDLCVVLLLQVDDGGEKGFHFVECSEWDRR